jgi:hypothetical protein
MLRESRLQHLLETGGVEAARDARLFQFRHFHLIEFLLRNCWCRHGSSEVGRSFTGLWLFRRAGRAAVRVEDDRHGVLGGVEVAVYHVVRLALRHALDRHDHVVLRLPPNILNPGHHQRVTSNEPRHHDHRVLRQPSGLRNPRCHQVAAHCAGGARAGERSAAQARWCSSARVTVR